MSIYCTLTLTFFLAQTKINRPVINQPPCLGHQWHPICSESDLLNLQKNIQRWIMDRWSCLKIQKISPDQLHVYWQVGFCCPSITSNLSILPCTTGLSLCYNWIAAPVHPQPVLQNPDGGNFNQFSFCSYLLIKQFLFLNLYFLTLRCFLVSTNTVSSALSLGKKAQGWT